MNSLEECGLPQPETAHIRDPIRSSTTTVPRELYTPPIRHQARMKPRLINWSHPRHNAGVLTGASTPDAFNDPFLNYFKAQTVKHGETASCVFLLWNSLPRSQSSTCSVMKAIDVPIQGTHSMTVKGKRVREDEAFQSMRRAFYKNNNSFASYLGLRVVSAVRPIKFRLTKLHEPGILVSPLAADWLLESREKCRANMAGIQELLDQGLDPQDFDYPGPEEFSSWKSQLNWLDTVPFLTLYFLHPGAAKGQNILNSPFSEGYRYQYREIESRPERERRFLVLDGLYVEEQWKTSLALPLVVIVLFLTLVLSRLIWKSWEVVFGAASFAAAVITLIYTTHHT